MSDSYLSVATIAGDQNMTERLNAAVTQQWHLGNIDLGANGNNPFNVLQWVQDNRYVWASSPGWGAAWDSALAAHPPETEPDYEPGKDPGVITDGMILATVQALAGTPALAEA
jgi:hypothetical protein